MKTAPLPPFVRDLLHELYDPYGKRRTQEAFKSFGEALEQVIHAMEVLGGYDNGCKS